jgi:hypothetical protein
MKLMQNLRHKAEEMDLLVFTASYSQYRGGLIEMI